MLLLDHESGSRRSDIVLKLWLIVVFGFEIKVAITLKAQKQEKNRGFTPKGSRTLRYLSLITVDYKHKKNYNFAFLDVKVCLNEGYY